MDLHLPIVVEPEVIESPALAVAFGPRVLLVEDERGTRKVLATLLADAGYRVEEADRLAKARQLTDKQLPELVIVDGLLPDGLGVDLVAELRMRNYAGKIIFISSFFGDLKSYQRLAHSLRVDRILRKPQTPVAVVQAARSLVPAQIAAP